MVYLNYEAIEKILHIRDVSKLLLTGPYRHRGFEISHGILSRESEEAVEELAVMQINLKRLYVILQGSGDIHGRANTLPTIRITAFYLLLNHSERTDRINTDKRHGVLGGMIVRTLEESRTGIEVADLEIKSNRGLEISRYGCNILMKFLNTKLYLIEE